MNNKQCAVCYFGDKCNCLSECGNYCPITEYADDERIEQLLREEYSDYRSAWLEYINEYE